MFGIQQYKINDQVDKRSPNEIIEHVQHFDAFIIEHSTRCSTEINHVRS